MALHETNQTIPDRFMQTVCCDCVIVCCRANKAQHPKHTDLCGKTDLRVDSINEVLKHDLDVRAGKAQSTPATRRGETQIFIPNSWRQGATYSQSHTKEDVLMESGENCDFEKKPPIAILHPQLPTNMAIQAHKQ